jgi:diguanylate cyclase (GGDEF)-like protein
VTGRGVLALHRLLAAVIALAGAAVLAHTLAADTPAAVDGAPLLLWVLVAAVVAGELVPVQVVLRGHQGELAPSTAFAFALMIAFGPGAAIPALCAGGVIGDLLRRKGLLKVAFNAGQYALSLFAAGLLMQALTAVPREPLHSFVGADLPALLLCGGVFFALNGALVAAVIALERGEPVAGFIAADLGVHASAAGFALGLAPLIVLVGEFSVGMLPLLALPLIAIQRNTRQALVNEHQALHDTLTGLPNRALFHDRVHQAIQTARREEAVVAVMVMDLDHFKEINDTLGHYHGDRLLQLVGERLGATLRGADTVARLGGDEFAVLLPRVRDSGQALEVAEKLIESLGRSFEIDGLSLEVGASVGIACFPEHGEDGETLLQRADIAMYVAKNAGSGARLYEIEHDKHSVQRLALAGELRRAIEHDELVLHYQPKIDVATGRIVGAEALCRWQHPSLGLVMPNEFVPMAEHTGLITPLTRRVLELALAQIGRWHEAGHRLSVAVNLSARSFLDAHLLEEELPRLIRQAGIDPALLELEITESMIVGDPDRARAVLEGLNRLGVTLAIDDFGTGYSSLAYLRLLPVDEIKIDRSFVFEMAGDRSGETIVRSIIDLAHNLGLRAVAEGVEDQALLTRLTELGCDVAQGFHISRPLPPHRFDQWVRSYPLRAAWLDEGSGREPLGLPAVA